MSVTIRRATQNDLEPLVNLWQEIADYHAELDARFALASDARSKYREHLTLILNSDTWRILIAEDDGAANGFITATLRENPIFKTKLAGSIHDAFVTASCRRRGVGEQLVNAIGEWFRERNVSHIELGASLLNPIGLAFWHKMGFNDYVVRMRRESV